jgi:thiosulfate dehydrogenase
VNVPFPKLALAAGVFIVSCSEPAESSAARGQELFTSRASSASKQNLFSCSSCHDSGAPAAWLKPGASLVGVTQRRKFWGGQEVDLLASLNACRRYFMFASSELTPANPEADALYAFLLSLEPGSAEPVPFTIVRDIEDLPLGDAASGHVVYARACSFCHGGMHTGAGRLHDRVPLLPEDTLASHAEFTPRVQRLIFIEKVRHGLFLGYGGDMPPFSREVLSDEQVSDLLQALGVLGQ